MVDRQRVWLWSAAILSMVVGLIFVLNDSAAGWFLIILGITYLGVSTRHGQRLAASNPNLVRWGLVGISLLIIILVIIVGAIFLLK